MHNDVFKKSLNVKCCYLFQISNIPWASSEPDNHNGREDCVAMFDTPQRHTQMQDRDCRDYMNFICEFFPGTKIER